MKNHYRHETDCLNCGTELQGKFCHNCGQENLEMKESFGHMANHAVSDYFHFDKQFFYTLKPLLFKPGKLTIEYLNGHRASYLHPVKMYIFISLVYFLLVFNVGGNQIVKINDKVPSKKGVATIAPVVINDTEDINNRDSTYAQYELSQSKLSPDKRDVILKRFFRKSIIGYKEKYGKNWLEHFQEDVKHNFPKMMFVLLPLYALILNVTFSKNKKYYVEHLIFTIHFHCFFFLFWSIFIVLQLLAPLSWHTLIEWVTLLMCLYNIYYLYRSLRNVYQRSRWRTISKMIGTSFVYIVLLSLGMMGVVALTAAAI